MWHNRCKAGKWKLCKSTGRDKWEWQTDVRSLEKEKGRHGWVKRGCWAGEGREIGRRGVRGRKGWNAAGRQWQMKARADSALSLSACGPWGHFRSRTPLLIRLHRSRSLHLSLSPSLPSLPPLTEHQNVHSDVPLFHFPHINTQQNHVRRDTHTL